jgi:predicted nucleic acid-binding Zn ribbon protein
MSKYCIKCGRPIPQNSKSDSCENCQNKKNGKIRKIGEGVLGIGSLVVSIVLLVITRGKFGGPKA